MRTAGADGPTTATDCSRSSSASALVGIADSNVLKSDAVPSANLGKRPDEVGSRGAEVASALDVIAEDTTPTLERRGAARTDRRRHSRSGRRDNDPRVNWRLWAWLFAAYALFMSIRSLPSTAKRKLLDRSKAAAS